MTNVGAVISSYSFTTARSSRRPWLEAGVGVLIAWGLSHGLGWQLPVLDFSALAVALIASRYGYVVGGVAGLAAGVLNLATTGHSLAGVLAVFGDRAGLTSAFVYVVVGALVGLVGDGPHEEVRRAGEAFDRLKANHDRLSERYGVMLSAKEAVDKRIVGQVQTVASLYEAARELATLVPGKIPGATLRLLAKYLEVEAAAIYMFEGKTLTLVEALGDRPGRPALIDPDTHPLGHVLAGHAHTPQLAPGETPAALLAVPLTHLDGRPRGVLAVEQLPFHQLTPATAQMLSLFADWASRALANSEAYVQAQELQRDHPVTGLHRPQPLMDRLHQEWASARRYKLALSVILVRQPALEHADQASWEAGASALAKKLLASVRNIDVAGHYRTRDTFVMVLPVTPLAGARILAGRIEAQLDGAIVEAASNEEGHADLEAMLQALQQVAFAPQEVRHAG